jgi:hypothetical protein
MAREADGRWRLHPSLAVADHHLREHARRRVRWLQPDADGVFEFASGRGGFNELGQEIFALYVRYRKNGTPDD